MPLPAPPPLLLTRDPLLLEEVLRLAAAAGVTPELAGDAAGALRGWGQAPLVLLGADLAEEVAQLAPARRAGVHLLSWGEVPAATYRAALAVGGDGVAELPRAAAWLTGLLTDVGDAGGAPGRVVGVVGGSGGAGATTFACGLAQVAARRGPALVVDCDPWGPGTDRVLGLDEEAGARWDTLAGTNGRLSARSLREAVPRRGDLGVLSWPGDRSPGPAAHPEPVVVREALSAAQRGHDTVVVDLPRGDLSEGRTGEVAARCDLVVVLVAPTISGVASAARLCRTVADPARWRLVVRGRGIDQSWIGEVTGVAVAAVMADQRGLAERVDLGLGPVRSARGPLVRAAREVLALLGSGHLGAAVPA